MKRVTATVAAVLLALATAGGATMTASASGTHSSEPGHEDGEPNHDGDSSGMMKDMRELHRSHEHEHDFKAMEEMSPEQGERVMKLMREVGIVMPLMDPEHGRKLFAQKGCVVCHSVNGVGGEDAPTLNAQDMPSPMNAFEFAARMWRGAPAMIAMQQEELGDVISLNGEELADLVAFAHDRAEQKKFTLDQVPKKFRDKLGK